LPIAEYRSNVPEIYQRIIDKALAKAPYYRYTSGADLSGDIALVFDFLRRAAPDVSPQDKFSRVRALRFFKDFQDTELWEIVTAAEWTEIEAGRKIVHEGEIDPSFYVLIDGSVSVLKGQRAIIQLGAGDCFGEMALISGRRRSATIVADLPVTAVKLRASIIDHVSVSCQNKFQRSFLTALIERLETATEQISEMPLPPSGAS
jgi:CRP-like cAMP-binding protein